MQGTIDLRKALEQTLRFDVEELCKETLRKCLPREGDQGALAFFAQALYKWSVTRIRPKPRIVFYSAALQRNPLFPKYQERIEEISELLRCGDDTLNDPDMHYLSKDYYKAVHGDGKGGVKVKLDKLLQEWQIHHFHIGKEHAAEELLYAIVLENAVCMIDLFGHGRDFADSKVLLHAKREWPQLFEGVGLDGVRGSIISPEAIKRFRERGVNYFLDVDGTAFTPLTLSMIGGCPMPVRLALNTFAIQTADVERNLCDQESPDFISIAHPPVSAKLSPSPEPTLGGET